VNLLCVIDNLAPGGAQGQLVNLGVGLRRLGHTVVFFVYHPQDFLEGTLREAGIPVRRSCKRSRWSLRPVVDLRKELRSGGYDAALSFLDTPNVYLELARIGSGHSRLVVSERSILPSSPSPGVSCRLQLHRLADYITTNAHHQREQLKRLCPWAADRVGTVWNGVDLDRFKPAARPRHEGPLKLLVVSSVAPFKNGVRLIEALDILRSRSARPLVTWVGAHQLHIPMRRAASEEMLSEIARRGLQPQWRWLAPSQEIAALMQSHDALIHASYLEGLPNAICEALAAGLPVLASNVLDHPRLVGESNAGLLFNPLDPASLAGAIEDFSALGPDERWAMGQRGREFAEKHLSMDRFVASYEAILGCTS
jgi:glycosyltransferase involved in cell wall biosynthesis